MRQPARVTLKALAALMLVAGCASQDARRPYYYRQGDPVAWDGVTRTVYLSPDLVDWTCRAVVGWFTPEPNGRPVRWYNACFDAREDIIVLPFNPPTWLREHEQRHREGWSHE